MCINFQRDEFNSKHKRTTRNDIEPTSRVETYLDK